MNFLRLAVIIGALPNTIANGQVEDAVPLMADLNFIVNQVNANAAPLSNTALLNAANSFTAVQSGLSATAGSNFPIASQVQNTSFNTLSSILGTNTLTGRVAALALSQYVVGQIFSFVPSQTNSGAVNLSVDNVGFGPLQLNSASLIGGELKIGSPVLVMVKVSTPVFEITGNGSFLPKSGGVLTGALSLSSNPVSSLQPATKLYADNLPTTSVDFNFTFNGDFEIWGAGTAAAPTGWTLAGAGGTVAKNTTAGQFKYTLASAALTRSGTDVTLSQDIDLISGFGPVGVWQGKTVTFGCWVRATVASRVRLTLDDGVGATQSDFHSGGSSFEFLTVTRTIDNAATRVRIIGTIVTGDTTAQFDGAVLVRGSSVTYFIPSGWRGRKAIMSFGYTVAGLLPAGNTGYFGIGASATEVDAAVPIPFTFGVARNFRIHSNPSPSAGKTYIATIMKDAGASSITATIADANVSASDTTNELSVVGGSLLDMRVVASAGASTATGLMGTLEIEETPF